MVVMSCVAEEDDLSQAESFLGSASVIDESDSGNGVQLCLLKQPHQLTTHLQSRTRINGADIYLMVNAASGCENRHIAACFIGSAPREHSCSKGRSRAIESSYECSASQMVL